MINATTKTLLSASILAAVSGCASIPGTTSVTQGIQGVESQDQDGNAAIDVVSCAAPVKTISLSPLQCKASDCQEKAEATGNMAALIALANEQEGIPDLTGFGDGMTNMLTSSLQATGCFNMLDRELMAELAREQNLAGKEVTLQGAEILGTGAITSLSYDQSKTNFGGGLIPVIGGVSTSKVTAKIGMDFRLVDVDTGRVSYTQTYNAESGKRGFGIAAAGLIGSGFAGGSHSVKGGVEMEEAARQIIHNVTKDVVMNLVEPGNYTIETVTVTE